jgi:hypothetical protein
LAASTFDLYRKLLERESAEGPSGAASLLSCERSDLFATLAKNVLQHSERKARKEVALLAREVKLLLGSIRACRIGVGEKLTAKLLRLRRLE